MKRDVRALLGLAIAGLASFGAHAAEVVTPGTAVMACIDAAGRAHTVPPAILVVLLEVEGGRLGEVSPNKDKNGDIKSVDIGPMQVNDAWLPKLAAHWRASKEAAYLALRDEFCANIEGGAWILRQALDEAKGDLWEAIGLYHSHTESHKAEYLGKVLLRAQDLQRRGFSELAAVDARGAR